MSDDRFDIEKAIELGKSMSKTVEAIKLEKYNSAEYLHKHIEALSSKNEEQALVIRELVEALEPFSKAAEHIEEDNFPGEYPVHARRGSDGLHSYQLKAGDFRNARDAIAKAKP